MKKLGAPIIGATGEPLPLSAGRDHGSTVFISGQLGLAGGKLCGPGIAEQTNQTIDNIETLLAEAGLGLADVVKTTIWLTRAEDFPAFNTTYASRFTDPFPARSTVVAQLLIPEALVEIEVIALRGGDEAAEKTPERL